MKETIKNFLAMLFATALWVLAVLIIVAMYILFEAGPVWEEFVFLGVVGGLFALGVYVTTKNKRLLVAAGFPLFPLQ
jgi:hypothetical protein